MNKNILITGGCGFIGLNLVNYFLKKKNVNIRILDNYSSRSRKNTLEIFKKFGFDKSERYQIIEGDIKDENICKKSLINIDEVIHLAANTGVNQSMEDPISDLQNNILGTLNLLKYSNYYNVKHFILASSGAPIGIGTPPFNELKLPKPISPYGASKLAAEAYCHVYSKSFGIKTTILRFSNVYGPYSFHKTSVVSTFIKSIILNKEIIIYGDGNQTRDFIYVDDLINAIINSSKNNEDGGIYHIATQKESSINYIIKILKKEFHEKGDYSINIKKIDKRVGDVDRNFAEIKKASENLNFKPSISLVEGLKKTINNFIEYKKDL
tara:strand:- start:31 stop:1002 length:972 start_codon:yes stop_codon:yes gene_type:complete